MMDCRRKIILDYAKWTALSALRSGAPVKSREVIYPLLDAVEFDVVLNSSKEISTLEFDAWHERETKELSDRESRLQIGWSAKLINVYLKTAAYVGELGRQGLRDVLHPPIDGGLRDGFEQHFGKDSDIFTKTFRVKTIKGITDYAIYREIIDGCEEAAKELGCLLIEVEQLWQAVVTPSGTEGNTE